VLTLDQDNLQEVIREILKSSIKTIEALESKFELEIIDAAKFLQFKNPQNLILLGSGKSGYIASRLAATLRSLGFNAFFLHSGELLHGDVGAISTSSLLMIFSNSGKTHELVQTAQAAKLRDIPIISFTGHPGSLIGNLSDKVIDLRGSVKNDFLGYVPTATLTAASLAGDCFVGVLSHLYSRGLTEFLSNHPDGSLGLFLNTGVSQLMKPITQVALFQPKNTLQEVARELTKFPNGIGIAVTESFEILGIVTDGDIRRLVSETLELNPSKILIGDYINDKPAIIQSECTVAEALNLMITNKPKRISTLPVVNKGVLVGVITMNDIEQRRDINAKS
jgi:arabinose-5-phosphate isomerase